MTAPIVRKPLLRVLAGEREPIPPLWLMRQAGRYLPEYRALREKAAGFLDLCFDAKRVLIAWVIHVADENPVLVQVVPLQQSYLFLPSR